MYRNNDINEYLPENAERKYIYIYTGCIKKRNLGIS